MAKEPAPIQNPFSPFDNSMAWHAARPIVRGAVANVIFPWYGTGCRANLSELDIKALSGLDANSYKTHEKQLKTILQDVMGIYTALYKKQAEITPKEEARREKASERMKMQNAKRMAARRASIKLTDIDDSDAQNRLPQKLGQSNFSQDLQMQAVSQQIAEDATPHVYPPSLKEPVLITELIRTGYYNSPQPDRSQQTRETGKKSFGKLTDEGLLYDR